MSSKFSVCLLTQGSGSAPEFLVSEVNLRPGQRFLPENRDDVLLAGGFSSLSPETGFPLSPTLHLNHALCNFSEAELKQIATAELERMYTTSFRSYAVEPDKKLCVLSSNAEKLSGFLDSYGGILDIEPILLAGYHLELPTATELSIHNEKDGYRLDYSIRAPVDSTLCTYCGACGPACPERCLDEQLFLDFSVCTFCKECEKVCEHKAIDIYSVEKRVMRIPAVLLLDGTQVELPENVSGIYHEDELPAFMATQYASQIDEVVTCDNSICQYSGHLGFGCRLCVDACRYGAVSREADGIRIDGRKCEECGACVASCPTGSLQYERFNDRTFVEYCDKFDLSQGMTVVFGSEKALHSFWWRNRGQKYRKVLFLEYATVEALTLFHLLFLFARGACRIILLGRGDEVGRTESLAGEVALANTLIKSLYDYGSRVKVSTVDGLPAVLREDGGSPISAALPRYEFGNRRKNLSVVLHHLTRHSGREAGISGESGRPFATVSCDEDLCTQCFACLNGCRIQALSTDEEQLALTYQPSLCVGCGICVRVCPEKALRMTPGVSLEPAYFQNRNVAEAEPMACKKCGKVFGTRKSYERVMQILSNRESVDTSHFEYCDTCRVVKLFESA